MWLPVERTTTANNTSVVGLSTKRLKMIKSDRELSERERIQWWLEVASWRNRPLGRLVDVSRVPKVYSTLWYVVGQQPSAAVCASTITTSSNTKTQSDSKWL
ncbi:hypothetical protein PV325_013119 [Microctonus aethiopoides]|nr:hypothetical protein PV325_013119 [Microctonus aethiopoides]